jgi:acylphosphatase
MAEELHVLVSGLVQGVGYRHSTYRRALELGLRGWVRNLPTGNVEAVFQGDRATIERMIEWCRRGPALARVDDVKSNWQPASRVFDDFQIAF